MVFCTQCGTANSPEANFCKNCRFPLHRAPTAAQVEASAQRAARDLSTQLGEMGRQIGRQFEAVGKDVRRRWDQELGPFGPVLSALFRFAFLVIVLLVIAAIAAAPGSRPFFADLRDFLVAYLPLFLTLMLLSSYASYFARTRRREYKWFAPIVAALGIVAGFWIVARVLEIMDREFAVPVFAGIIAFVGVILPIIIVVALVIGYITMTLRFVGTPERIR